MIDDEVGTRPRRRPRISLAPRPAAICIGPGHVVVYGNPEFVEAFGSQAVGLPLREGVLGLDRSAFALLDAVYRRGRPLGRWIERDGTTWRMTGVPRLDPATLAVEGVAFNLRERNDRPLPTD
jgi:hypothetical protein